MANYETPGAYIERDDRAQGGISRLRTDVVGFIGIARRGPARRAVAIESFKQFQAVFGGMFVHGYLAYVVRAFFENGGRRCWIVRVEGEGAATSAVELASTAGAPVWRVEANSSGAWGNALSARLIETRRISRRVLRAIADWAEVRFRRGHAARRHRRADPGIGRHDAARVARDLGRRAARPAT